MVSEEPLSIVAPQACIELRWRIAHQGHSSTPPSSCSNSRPIQTCVTLLAKPSPAAGDCNRGYYNTLLQYAPLWRHQWPHCVCYIYLERVWKCCSVSSYDYCGGTDSWRLLQFVSHWQTAVTVCVWGYGRLLVWSEFVLYPTALTHSALYLFPPRRAQTMSHMSAMWAITFPRTTPAWLITSPDKVGPILHHHEPLYQSIHMFLC